MTWSNDFKFSFFLSPIVTSSVTMMLKTAELCSCQSLFMFIAFKPYINNTGFKIKIKLSVEIFKYLSTCAIGCSERGWYSLGFPWEP